MMDHPNIAKVLDAGSTESGRPYFVMELVKGVPITEYCDRESLSTRERLRLFVATCHAVQHAHQKGIIHRDIKPSNVLVTMLDGVAVPKVIDFGIAKATSARLTEQSVFTQMGQFIGTPEYMSPEQAEMSEIDIDTRSDVYSLGVLLYELLTGTTPFASMSLRRAGLAEIQRIIREEDPPRPSTRVSSLASLPSAGSAPASSNAATLVAQPRGMTDAASVESSLHVIAKHRRTDPKSLSRFLRGDLDWIIMKALEKNRTRRYETANGFAADIERYLAGEPVVAAPPSGSYRMRKFMKRNKAGVTAASLVAMVLVLGIAGTTWGMLWALNERDRADGEADRATMEADRATRELARATEIKRLITEMLQSVTPEQAKSADVTLLKGILKDAANRLAAGEIADELIAAELHTVVGDVYWRLGLYPEAENHLPVAVDICRRVLGEEHPVTLRSTTSLASLRRNQARYAEAESLFLETLETQERVLGTEHADTLMTSAHLAGMYGDLGRPTEAEPLALSTLEIRMRVLGEEHPNTVSSMQNLAILYSNQGRYAEAEPIALKALEILKRDRGDNHPETLKTIGTLGNLYAHLGRYAEAEPLWRQTLEEEKRVKGVEHPDVLMSWNNLAGVNRLMGNSSEAEKLYLEALEIENRVMGEEHPITLRTMTNLAVLYQKQRRYDEAEPMYIKTFEIQKRVLGEEASDTLRSKGNLANLYHNMGRLGEAEVLYAETLEVAKRILGEDYPDTLVSMNGLAFLYASQGKYAQAEPLSLHALQVRQRTLGNDHPLTVSSMKSLAAVYLGQEKREEAATLYRDVLAMKSAAADKVDATAPTLFDTAYELLNVEIEELRDPENALVYAQRACALGEAENAANLFQYLNTLAQAQHRTDNTAAAISNVKRAIEFAPEAFREPLDAALAEYEAALTEGASTRPATSAPATTEP